MLTKARANSSVDAKIQSSRVRALAAELRDRMRSNPIARAGVGQAGRDFPLVADAALKAPLLLRSCVISQQQLAETVARLPRRLVVLRMRQ